MKSAIEMPHHFISADQFPPQVLEIIFQEAERLRKINEEDPKLLKKNLPGKIIVELFLEQSTRTFTSFSVAGKKQAADVIEVLNAGQASSLFKGESLGDTGRTDADLGIDVIVMRHNKSGSAQILAEYLDKYAPQSHLINAGDGNKEHPTQMILDMYTIWRNKRQELESGELVVALCGDLRDSRVFHSDAIALAEHRIKEIIGISEKGNDLPDDIIKKIREKGVKYTKTSDIMEFVSKPDVWMFTRIQLERKNILVRKISFLRNRARKTYNKLFGVTRQLLAAMKIDAIIMHPLPRTGEIPEWVDEDPRALYLSRCKGAESQVTNGLYSRMAILNLILG